jgi:hypothetical protein
MENDASSELIWRFTSLGSNIMSPPLEYTGHTCPQDERSFIDILLHNTAQRSTRAQDT